MIEITTHLLHDGEVRLFAQFTEALLINREAERQAAAAPKVDAADLTGAIGPEGRVELPPKTEPTVPEPVETVESLFVSDSDLVAAFQKHGVGKPVTALHELLKSFGAARVTEVEQGSRAAFVTALGALT